MDLLLLSTIDHEAIKNKVRVSCVLNKLTNLHAKNKGLTMRLLLLATEQRQQRSSRNAHNFEANSGNISDSVTRATESSNQHFIVLIHKV